MYKVLTAFFDLQDNNYAYSVGEKYPHGGIEISAERFAELESSKNKLGVPVIKKVQKRKKTEK